MPQRRVRVPGLRINWLKRSLCSKNMPPSSYCICFSQIYHYHSLSVDLDQSTYFSTPIFGSKILQFLTWLKVLTKVKFMASSDLLRRSPVRTCSRCGNSSLIFTMAAWWSGGEHRCLLWKTKKAEKKTCSNFEIDQHVQQIVLERYKSIV